MEYTTEFTHSQTELLLCAENNPRYNDVGRMLSRHFKRGKFQFDQAVVAVDNYLLRPTAREQAGPTWFLVWPKAERMAVAHTIAQGFIAEFRLGNTYD